MSNRPGFRRRMLQRRAPPRIISLGGVIGSGAQQAQLKSLIPEDKLNPVSKPSAHRPPRPVIINSVTVRPEPNTKLPPSIRTTVLTLPERDTAPRMSPPRREIPAGLRLHANASTKRTNTSSSKYHSSDPARQVTSSAAKKGMTSALVGEGLALSPGQTHIWKLIPNGVSPKSTPLSERPTLTVDGDQGVRISFMRSLGSILQDVDIPPSRMPVELTAPPETSLVAASGLGGAGQVPDIVQAVPSGITSVMSTNNVTGVGFQPSSTVIQVGPTNYLCRGGLLKVTSASGSKPLGKSIVFDAMHALGGQTNVSLFGPTSIETLVVIIPRGAKEQPGPSMMMDGLEVVSGPVKIVAPTLEAFVWGVNPQSGRESDLFCCTIEVGEGFGIHSMIGLSGPAEQWVESLQNREWIGLVEEGPLTQSGRSSLTWGYPTDIPQPMMRAPKEPPVREEEPAPSKVQSNLPVFAADDAFVNEDYAYDFSHLADDPNEDDVLRFEKLGGPSWVTLDSEGRIHGTPAEHDVGVSRIVVRVVDQELEGADAEIRINVSKRIQNLPPFWKTEMRSVTSTKESASKKKSTESKGKSPTRGPSRRGGGTR